LNATPAQMNAVLTDPLHRIDLNEPSVYHASLPGAVTTTRSFTNIDSQTEVYNVTATSGLPGGVTVSPSTLTVKPGQTATLTITLNGVNGTVGTWYFGQIDLAQKNGSNHLHLPVAFSPSDTSTTPLVTMSSACTPTTIAVGAQTSCTAKVQNNAFVPATVSARMTSTNNLKVVSAGSGTVSGRVASFGPVNLAAATPPKPHVGAGSSPDGYLPLEAFGIALQPIGDEDIVNFNVPSFVYDGQTFSRLGIASDGYLVVGGGDSNDIQPTPPNIPNPARPNNVLAPFWTDLDGGDGAITGQGYRIGILSDGVHRWLVVQVNEHPFNGSPLTIETFQVWIGLNGTQDISYTYDPSRPLSDPNAALQVGAEDTTGQFGNSVPGIPSADLTVTSTPGAPGGSAAFTATFRGTAVGAGTVETDMTSSLIRDTVVSRANVTVTP
jgi:Fibronectin type-III domain